VLMGDGHAHIIVTLDTKEPIEIGDFVAAFTSIAIGSRDARRGPQPWVEGPHALRQRLSSGNEVYEALHLSQAA
jgi:hypothetical protein